MYSLIEKMVNGVLFSKFEERRFFSQKSLNEYLNSRVDVQFLKEGEKISTYLSFSEPSSYFLVGEYEDSLIEEPPMSEEEKSISSLGIWWEN